MRWWLSLILSVALGGPCLATTATLAWDAPLRGIPDTYLIYRQVQGQAWQLVGLVDAPQQGWVDPLTAQGVQCYRVTAANTTGESGSDNTLCVRCNPQRCRVL